MKKLASLIVASALFAFCITADAAWMCTVNNKKGKMWNSTGITRSLALEHAMGACCKHSSLARCCTIKNCSER